VTQSNRPDKRVHELTPAGREAVAEWLERCQEALT
jgi:DNA-binding PadR family transcriptional regulator